MFAILEKHIPISPYFVDPLKGSTVDYWMEDSPQKLGVHRLACSRLEYFAFEGKLNLVPKSVLKKLEREHWLRETPAGSTAFMAAVYSIGRNGWSFIREDVRLGFTVEDWFRTNPKSEECPLQRTFYSRQVPIIPLFILKQLSFSQLIFFKNTSIVGFCRKMLADVDGKPSLQDEEYHLRLCNSILHLLHPVIWQGRAAELHHFWHALSDYHHTLSDDVHQRYEQTRHQVWHAPSKKRVRLKI